MKKRKNLGKKLVTMLVSVGFFAVLITVLNLMALQVIREKNNVLVEQFEQYEEARRNLSRGFSAKVTNYSIDVFDNLFLRVSLRQFYIKFYAFSLSKTVEKRSSVDYTKRLSNTSNKFFSANCLTTSCIVSSTKFAYSSFDIVINLFMDLSISGK